MICASAKVKSAARVHQTSYQMAISGKDPTATENYLKRQQEKKGEAEFEEIARAVKLRRTLEPDDSELPSLTPKQRRFVEAYIGTANGNARKAAELAGYVGSPNTQKQIGYANLKHEGIQAWIKFRLDNMMACLRADEVLALLTETALTSEKMHHRLRALDLLGKYHAIWTDKLDVSGEVVYSVEMPGVDELGVSIDE